MNRSDIPRLVGFETGCFLPIATTTLASILYRFLCSYTFTVVLFELTCYSVNRKQNILMKYNLMAQLLKWKCYCKMTIKIYVVSSEVAAHILESYCWRRNAHVSMATQFCSLSVKNRSVHVIQRLNVSNKWSLNFVRATGLDRPNPHKQKAPNKYTGSPNNLPPHDTVG